MGVVWSQPKPVCNAKKILIKAAFPRTEVLRAKLWNLWKSHKQSLKEDGFSISRYNHCWYILYFDTVKDDTYNKVTTDKGPVAQYMLDFRKKNMEWQEVLEELNSIDHVQESNDDQESWYFSMENDQDE